MLENSNVKTVSKGSWVFLVLQLPIDSILVEFSIEAGLFFASKAGGGVLCHCHLFAVPGSYAEGRVHVSKPHLNGRMAVSCRNV